MPPWENLLAFTLTALVIVAVPGPSVLFVIGRSLAWGRRGGVLSVVGNALGMLPAVLAVALGVGAVVAQSAVVLTVLKVLGAAYLVHLGVQAIRHRRDVAAVDVGPRRSARRLLVEGALVGVTNPKTAVFFVAVLPQFVAPQAAAVGGQLLVFGLVFLVLALVLDSVWALAAGTARAWFVREPRRERQVAIGGGAMMIGLGGTLLVAQSRT